VRGLRVGETDRFFSAKLHGNWVIALMQLAGSPTTNDTSRAEHKKKKSIDSE
jgi:hypothetical protein